MKKYRVFFEDPEYGTLYLDVEAETASKAKYEVYRESDWNDEFIHFCKNSWVRRISDGSRFAPVES